MSEYCQCKYCKYINSNETWGCKWYCEWLRAYVDPDEWHDDCSHFREN